MGNYFLCSLFLNSSYCCFHAFFPLFFVLLFVSFFGLFFVLFLILIAPPHSSSYCLIVPGPYSFCLLPPQPIIKFLVWMKIITKNFSALSQAIVKITGERSYPFPSLSSSRPNDLWVDYNFNLCAELSRGRDGPQRYSAKSGLVSPTLQETPSRI